MTKNESKYRTRIIQELHLKKIHQLALDQCVAGQTITYKKFYYMCVFYCNNKIIKHCSHIKYAIAVLKFKHSVDKATQALSDFMNIVKEIEGEGHGT